MANNTLKHISDKSEFKTFDPTGTRFAAGITNVQAALAAAGPFVNASTGVVGSIQLATQAEVDAGTNNTKAVTPATLKARMNKPAATETVAGVAMLATQADATAGTDHTKIITPKTNKGVLDNAFNTRVSTELMNGVIKISTEAAAITGTDDTTAMTPKKVAVAIAKGVAGMPIPGTATEGKQGMVQLATVGQVETAITNNLREGFAISPYTFMMLKAAPTKYGIVKVATQADVNAGTADDIVVSAKGFKTFIATTANFGTVKLTQNTDAGVAGTALASNANVLGTNKTGTQTVTGTVNYTGALQSKGAEVLTEAVLGSHIPIGTIVMWGAPNPPPGGKWWVCDGAPINKNHNPELFAAYGYTHGGSGDWFNLPDMQGLFVRGVGRSGHISSQDNPDGKGKPGLGLGVSGGVVGEVQKQMIRGHKHVLPWGEHRERRQYWAGASINANNNGISAKQDWDNYNIFTNEGWELQQNPNDRDEFGTVNTEGLMGMDNRPWNMSLFYIIKIA